jgi:hypothetical protein
MDKSLVDTERQKAQDKPTDKLVELYNKRSSFWLRSDYSDEFFEAIRLILVERRVSDASLDLSPS